MVTESNECMGCAVPQYPCRGDSCPYRHVKHYICDQCGEELDIDYDPLYEYEGEQLCTDCLLEKVPKVRADE